LPVHPSASPAGGARNPPDAGAPCVFCEIVAGREPASFAYEDDRVVAFMDLAAANPGHLLVVPRAHAASVADLEDALGAHLFAVAKRMAAALRESGLRCEGMNLFVADGEAAGQEVFHAHVHVLPRWEGDRFRVEAEWMWPDRSELDAAATAVRSADERLRS
jgi:histidine triad (HIT) family protein